MEKIKLKDYDVKLLKNLLDEIYKDFDIERRTYQENILLKAVLLLEMPKINAILIESPTGSGKTVMGLLLARYFHEKYGYKVGWSTMRKNLLSQTEKANKKFGINLPIKYMSIFEKNPEKVDVRIDDEAHHAVCSSGLRLHNKTDPKITIGLTATPFRSDKASLLYNSIIREVNLRRLVKENYLAQFNHYTIDSWTPANVAKTFLNEPKKWGKSVAFFHQEYQCYEFAQYINEAGFKCEVVTAKTNKEAQIERFIKGEVDILVNMLILTEGLDVDDIETVFVKPSGKGITIQMGGRVLRKSPNIEHKNIVQCKFSKNPFYKFAEPKQEFFMEEGEWKSHVINENMNIIIGNLIKMRCKDGMKKIKKRALSA